MTNIVSGAVSTITDLGKDEAWMCTWLSEQPSRLGLGELTAAEGEQDDDARSFAAVDEERCFSVDVQLGELEASRGFGVLDNWARNRVRHPDKEHVAVLVTETLSDRYQTTLETLAEHLPLVVVELQVWKGEDEAIVVPHVALASEEVDLSETPAAKAAEAMARAEAMVAVEEPDETVDADTGDDAAEPATDEFEAEAESETGSDQDDDEPASDAPENKDDTGVGNPWGLPQREDEPAFQASGSGATGLLTKVG
jgi:hypothetical protein